MKILKYALTFVAGAAIGGVSGYIFGSKKAKAECEEELEEKNKQISALEKHVRDVLKREKDVNMSKNASFFAPDTDEKIVKMPKEEQKERLNTVLEYDKAYDATPEKKKEMIEKILYSEKGDYNKIIEELAGGEHPSDSEDSIMENFTLEEEEFFAPEEVISQEEEYNYPDYTTISLTGYVFDSDHEITIVENDTRSIIPDPETLLGESFFSDIWEYITQNDSVIVLNHRYKAIYEVEFVPGDS